VFVLATASAFLRLGSTSWRGVVFAEDGPVFLQGAHDHSLPAMLLEPYAGYANVTPRLVAELVSWLPLSWEGVGTILTSSALAGALALFVSTSPRRTGGIASQRSWPR